MFKNKEETEEKAKNKINLKQKLTIVRIVFYALSIYGIITFLNQEYMIRNYDKQIKEYQQNIEIQKQLLDEYKNQKDERDTDEIMERLARKHGYIKPSEKLYIDVNK